MKQSTAEGEFHLRRRPRAGANTQVGVEAERDRHGGILDRLEGQRELDRPRRDPCAVFEPVGEREQPERSVPSVPLEPRQQRSGLVIAPCLNDLPLQERRPRAVDRESTGISLEESRVRVQDDLLARRAVTEPTETVRPWMEERNTHGRAALDIALQPVSLCQELAAAERQRMQNHVGGGGEGRPQPVPTGTVEVDRLDVEHVIDSLTRW